MRYYLQTVPGIETIARRELQDSLDGSRIVASAPGRVVFDYPGDPRRLLDLGTAEDVFALVAHDEISAARRGLRQARDLVRKSPLLRRAVQAHRTVRGRGPRRPGVRVVSQRVAGKPAYRRVDLQSAVSEAIVRAFPGWKLVADDAHIECWVLQDRDELLCGLRLSDRTMRHRDYKQATVPASLRPVVARAMVLISEPSVDDVFTDPMCGAGTILIERGQHSPYAYLIGGDLDTEALAATRKNIGPRYKPIGLLQLDAGRLPLSDGSVHKLVSNLPFGKKSRGAAGEATLYAEFLEQAVRVLRPDGVAVLLTSQTRLLNRLVGERNALRVDTTCKIEVLGQRATIFRVRRV